MQGNLHVPFLGGWVGAIPPGYPADEETGFVRPRLVATQRECDKLSEQFRPFKVVCVVHDA